MILVTGGTGFVGRRVVAHLTAAGHDVRVLTRAAPPDMPQNAGVVSGDLRDFEQGRLDLTGFDTVVHLAAVLTGHDVVPVNVDGARALAGAARTAGVSRFIHCSSAGVYGDNEDPAPLVETDRTRPATPYERSKRDGEQAVLDALGPDVSWVILRPSGVYGPGRAATLEFLRRIQRARVWIHGPAPVIVHPTYVDDLAAAVAAVVARPAVVREITNIGGERALPLPELIAANARALGTRVRQIRLPAITRELAAAVRSAGVRSASVDRLARATINRGLDTRKATRLLGVHWIPLEAGIAKTVASFRERGQL